MKPAPRASESGKVTWLHHEAGENLRFIRESMERGTVFTGLSGRGYVVGGFTALPVAWLAAQQASTDLWLGVWLLELVLATCVMLAFTARKARESGTPLSSSITSRKLLMAFVPAMLAGGLLSFHLHLAGATKALPALWLTVYGAAVITAGAWSIRLIPLMGACFMLLGALAAFTPLNHDVLLALGFGGLHMGFGLWIWRAHGG